MRITTTALLSLLLFMSTTAIAQNYAPTRTYEVLVNSVRLPSSPGGTITVKECDDCDYETYRVTERTVYAIDGKSMRLEDFRLAIDAMRLDPSNVVNVRRDIQSNTIAKVFVYTQ
ncbi:MAG: hypothetical protein WBN07_03355 [Woeseiaceae bacterium]